MTWQGTTYTIPLMLPAAISAMSAFYLWRNRHTPSRRLYCWQAGLLVFAAITPWLVSAVVDANGVEPYPDLDLTPFALGLMSPAIAWGLSRLRRLDIVPAAHETVVGSMSDGVVVLDAQNRIVDLNPAAQHLFGRTLIHYQGAGPWAGADGRQDPGRGQRREH
jgi:PAS domain-containing protein